MPKENMLPTKIVDPFRSAENAIHLQGILSVKNMERLCSSLNSDSGEVNVSMEFGVDEQEIPFIRGELSTQVVLQCQRCMEPFSYDIADHFLLGIVRSEEDASRLPDRYNPVIANNDKALIIQDVIEDELLVSLPIVPMHHPKDCNVTLPLSADPKNMEESEKENPFKVIELLRSKHNSK